MDIAAGAIMLHQILDSRQFSEASGRVFEQLVEEIVKPSGGDLYLSVRKENAVACAFYRRHGVVLGAAYPVWCTDLPWRNVANDEIDSISNCDAAQDRDGGNSNERSTG